ncbi:MAG: hypothetical protein ACXWUR_10910 [Allosphingosinicella sp.]
MGVRRPSAAITVSLALLGAAPAAAQTSGAALVGPLDNGRHDTLFTVRPMEFRAPEGDLRAPAEPRRNGLIAAFPVHTNIEIGVGRFQVPQIARPRTHVEAERQPASVRPRDRGIAAVGVSFRFR